jgi:ATP-dependent DNA helicase RecQ
MCAAYEAAAAIEASDDEAWRLRSIGNRLKAVAASCTVADKGANLREAVRLSHNNLTLPLDGLGIIRDTIGEFSRFGITHMVLDGAPSRVHFSLLNEADVPAGLPEDLAEALKFDPHNRRPFKPEPPDGALLRLTRHTAYQNPTQKAAVRALLTMPTGSTLLVTMPTGAGKSLLFQLGVRWWREQIQDEKPMAIVIVPTVSLALDHVATLQSMPGLEKAQALLGGMGLEERERVLRDFQRGEIPVLFMAPESAFGSAREVLLKAAQPREQRVEAAAGRLTGVFIDEAHIIESWGRSFRPDFQRLRGLLADLREVNPELRAVLLSATVDDAARDLLRRDFSGHGSFLEIAATLPRYEFDVVVHRAVDDATRNALVLDAMDRLPRPALIYTTERAHAQRLYEALEGRGYKRLALFTGDTKDRQRRDIVNQWRHGDLDLVVATSAFGMGVDKADVRAVVHACLPEDASRYYQEIGRGGRDGYQAMALCLWTSEDVKEAESLVTGQLLTVDVAAERWNALVEASRALGPADVQSFPGSVLIRVPMNTAPGRITHQPGHHNRHWNRSLLNMLQRAGALEVRAVAAPNDLESEVWTVLIHQPALMDRGPSNDELLREVLNLREDEQRQSIQAVRDFIRVLTRDREICLLALLFELVEAGGPLVQPCGRCPVCRKQGIQPPRSLDFGGLKATWSTPGYPKGPLAGGSLLVHPDTSVEEALDRLVLVLAQAGVQQFLVPGNWGARTAQVLKGHTSNPGLVLESRHLLSGDWRVVPVPTSLLLDPAPDGREAMTRLVKTVFGAFKEWGHLPLVVLAPAGLMIEGRPFAQVAGSAAPYDEAGLVTICQGEVQ